MVEDKYFHQNPVRWKIVGNQFDALPYRGEATKLLWQLKNLMKFNDIKQSQMKRTFQDGTIIIARSVFGQDFIKIITPEELEKKKPFCSITLLNVPEAIPPMKWYAKGTETFTKVDKAWVIKDPSGEIEVEGVDYIKTYYRVNVIDCPGCSSLDFTIGKDIISIGENKYHPFLYRSERDDGSLIYTYEEEMVPHYMGNLDAIPPILPDPMNHMIYSLTGGGQVEIIKADTDGGGGYILWRAYTEWGLLTFPRTGLGYMLMQGFIKNEGKNLCESKPIIIEVDCCQKAMDDPTNRENPDNREVVMLAERETIERWKEGCEDREDCEIYEKCQEYWDWCEVPPELPPDALQEETSFRARPEEKAYEEGQEEPPGDGSCLPYIWEFNGLGTVKEFDPEIGQVVFRRTIEDLGTIEESGDFKESMVYTPPIDPETGEVKVGCGEITISVKDRCETVYRTHLNCCENAPEPSIEYTSLVMGCDASQTLTGTGGCIPYTWEVTSGSGTIIPSADSKSAVYTSPATNPNCNNNPTIKITDCCGDTAELKLAINCYTGTATALDAYDYHSMETGTGCVGNSTIPKYRWKKRETEYRCDNSISSQVNPNSAWHIMSTPPPSSCCGTPGCQYCVWIGSGGDTCRAKCIANNFYEFNTVTIYEGHQCIYDYRTQAMKDGGCCPLNPFTGLPY